MAVGLVPRARLGEMAPAFLRMLQPVAERTNGRYEATDWLVQASQDHMQVWVAFSEGGDPFDPDVMLLTEIVVYPRLKALRIIACAGIKFFEHYDEIETALLRKFGPLHGCTRFEIVGRSGWQKVLKRFGSVSRDHITEGALDEQVQGPDAAH